MYTTYIYIYVYMDMYTYIYIYIHIHIYGSRGTAPALEVPVRAKKTAPVMNADQCRHAF